MSRRKDTRVRNSANDRRLRTKYKAQRRMYLDGAKNVPCKDCGLRYPPICMDFDHVRGEKKRNVAHFIFTGSFKSMQDEIAKCEVVCANCHRLRTAARYRSNS